MEKLRIGTSIFTKDKRDILLDQELNHLLVQIGEGAYKVFEIDKVDIIGIKRLFQRILDEKGTTSNESESFYVYTGVHHININIEKNVGVNNTASGYISIIHDSKWIMETELRFCTGDIEEIISSIKEIYTEPTLSVKMVEGASRYSPKPEDNEMIDFITTGITGKTYIPIDNSWEICRTNEVLIGNLAGSHLNEPRECVIVSEPYEEEVYFEELDQYYTNTFINVKYDGEVYRTMYHEHRIGMSLPVAVKQWNDWLDDSSMPEYVEYQDNNY